MNNPPLGISEENEMSIEWVSAFHVNCIQVNFLIWLWWPFPPLLGNSLKTSVDYNQHLFLFMGIQVGVVLLI